VAKLLVSVRSRAEALAALAGGAAIIDVKEPTNGALGRAPVPVWREVRDVVPRPIPVSVALGELADGFVGSNIEVPRDAWAGLAYCKLGLANAPADWADRWRDLRRRLAECSPSTPDWVAVVYVDWRAASAPAPEIIIDTACAIESCRGVLFDSWDKSRCALIDFNWMPQVERVKTSGRFVALAGSLDVEAIRRLAPLAPDIFAVRGSACAGGDRLGPIDAERVSRLARAAAQPDT
jgi:(5-formylfuran-3-yl)methyl phosphate synthase